MIHDLYFFKVISSIEICESYINEFGLVINQENCTLSQPYCCGSCANRYCCPNKSFDQKICGKCLRYSTSQTGVVIAEHSCDGVTRYCCGNCNSRECCSNSSLEINQYLCSRSNVTTASYYSPNDYSVIIWVAIATVAAPILILCIIYCCVLVHKNQPINRPSSATNRVGIYDNSTVYYQTYDRSNPGSILIIYLYSNAHITIFHENFV